MNNIIAILFLFSLCLSGGLSFMPEFAEKFCDKSVTTDQITQMGSCEQYIPAQMKANTDKCLQQLKVGTTFTEFRNTVCDPNLRDKFRKCCRDNFEAERKASGNAPPPKPDGKFKQHKECMDKALGI